MKSAALALIGVVTFVLGAAALALTVWLWVGDWPQETKQLVDHMRSVEERGAHTGDPVIQDVYARDHVSLGGRWQAVIDPYARGDLAGLAPRAIEPKTPSDLAEFSFENGLELDVPGDWNSQDPRLVFYQGVVWYKRTFDHTPKPGTRSFLYFGGANYRTSVYLNGERVGKHVGGYSPFNFEVGDALREGVNLLVIDVDSEHTDRDIPTPRTDWMNYGGLTRSVRIIEVPETFVRGYHVQLAIMSGVSLLLMFSRLGPERFTSAAVASAVTA